MRIPQDAATRSTLKVRLRRSLQRVSMPCFVRILITSGAENSINSGRRVYFKLQPMDTKPSFPGKCVRGRDWVISSRSRFLFEGAGATISTEGTQLPKLLLTACLARTLTQSLLDAQLYPSFDFLYA